MLEIMMNRLQRIRRAVSRFVIERGVGVATVTVEVAWSLFPGASVQAAEVAGVKVEPRARVGGVDLVLNGAGMRQRYTVDVYVIGVYFAERTTVAERAIDAPGPKRVALIFMREVTAQSLVDALYEGIRDNTSETEFARLKTSADALAAIMLPLRTARKGDIVALDYLPGIGAQVLMNGKAVGEPVRNRDLYHALLKIWLGDPSVDRELKRELLSGRR